jgi:hypothetical protein
LCIAEFRLPRIALVREVREQNVRSISPDASSVPIWINTNPKIIRAGVNDAMLSETQAASWTTLMLWIICSSAFVFLAFLLFAAQRIFKAAGDADLADQRILPDRMQPSSGTVPRPKTNHSPF